MLTSLPNLYGGTVDNNPLTVAINDALQTSLRTKLSDADERLKDMDAQGIDVQAISPAPFHYNYDKPAEFARDTSVVVNDTIAETVASHPDRFVGLGTLPLQDVDMAIAELERCVNDLGFRGVEISTNVNGEDLTRAGLEKLFQRIEEMGVLIFIHPIGTSYKERLGDHYFRNTIGHPLSPPSPSGISCLMGTWKSIQGSRYASPTAAAISRPTPGGLIIPIICATIAGSTSISRRVSTSRSSISIPSSLASISSAI